VTEKEIFQSVESLFVAEFRRRWLRTLETLRKRELPTSRDFVRNLAALGGFLMRKVDGEPGWTTLWRGAEHVAIALKTQAALRRRCE
jgi:hypothetical protein